MVETLHCSVYFLFIFNFNNDNSQITDYRLQITDAKKREPTTPQLGFLANPYNKEQPPLI